MKAALLIVDMQKGCYVAKSKDSIKSAIGQINETSRFFRENGHPVVVIQDVSVGKGPGSKKFEVLDEVETSQNDISIHKKELNAFWQTELDGILKEMKIDFLVISGYSVDYCVLSTFFGACERGYNAVLLQHGVAGSDENGVKNIQYLRPVISHNALEYFLKA